MICYITFFLERNAWESSLSYWTRVHLEIIYFHQPSKLYLLGTYWSLFGYYSQNFNYTSFLKCIHYIIIFFKNWLFSLRGIIVYTHLYISVIIRLSVFIPDYMVHEGRYHFCIVYNLILEFNVVPGTWYVFNEGRNMVV